MNRIPFLKPSLCAFIDILGFADSILDAYKANTQDRVFNEVFSALTESTQRISSAGNRLPFLTVKMFTDNIVIVCEKSFAGVAHTLTSLCELIADYQLAMACRGYFIRGAIAEGTIAVDDQIIFGDALIKAHRFESTVACNPRVIIDPDLVKLAEEDMLDAKEIDKSIWRHRIMKDIDEYYFVNYLDESYVPVPGKGRRLEISKSILEQHRVQITTNLIERRKQPHIWAKYLWSANYHNSFCDHATITDIKIDPSHFQVEPLIIE